MRQSFFLRALWLICCVACVAGCSPSEPETLPAVQSAAKKQPGANTPPAQANGITAAQVRAAKNGD